MNLFSVKRLLILLGFIVVMAVSIFIWIYNQAYSPNVQTINDVEYFHISSDAIYSDVLSDLEEAGLVKDFDSFRWTAEKMKLPKYFKPGRYEIIGGMSNRELIQIFRIGEQVPVNYILKPVRSIEQLAANASIYLEPDSNELIQLLKDDDFIKDLGYNSATIISMFIPNTYQFKWNTTANDFYSRMKLESDKFWSKDKLKKAEAIGMNKVEISVMASIVEKETSKDDEKATVAGVYMNRYKKGMKLQADPTLIFAINDFGIRRVLNKHKKVDSPYNTYIHAGLPPGPICSPSISSINAVLDYEKHDYLFFCAKEDFSGYHNFAKTYSQHINNAKKFQRELDKRNIRS